jgi:hypothetical protein
MIDHVEGCALICVRPPSSLSALYVDATEIYEALEGLASSALHRAEAASSAQ